MQIGEIRGLENLEYFFNSFRVVKESAAAGARELPIAFGNVQRGGGAGSIEWVGHSEGLRDLLQQRLKPRDKRQRCLVDPQLFMIEPSVHDDYDYHYETPEQFEKMLTRKCELQLV